MSACHPRRIRPAYLMLQLLTAALVLTAALHSGLTAKSAAATGPLGAEERARVDALIEQLGDESYASRMEAQQKLRLYGVEVLDALRQADHHPNPQIARTAGYLLRSSNVVWSVESDSPTVRKWLRAYESDNLSGRATLVGMLATLSDDEGVAALARIARYEFSSDLARRAAIKLLTLDDFGRDAQQLQARWQTVLSTIEDSQASPCQWLRQAAGMYLNVDPAAQRPDLATVTRGLTLREILPGNDFRMMPVGLIGLHQGVKTLPPSAFDDAWWAAQIDAEEKLLVDYPGETSREVLENLCCYRAETLVRCGRRTDALHAASRILQLPKLEDDDPRKAFALAKWAIDHAMPEFAIQLLESQRENRFSKYLFLYRCAEAYLWIGDVQTANRLAAEALEASSGRDRRDIQELAENLAGRGLYDWAQREYRSGLDPLKTWNAEAYEIVRDYSHLLQDANDHAAVDELLAKFIDDLKLDPSLQQFSSETISGVTKPLQSTQLHSRGKVEVAAGQIDKAKASWREAIALSPENVDIVIDMQRLEGDAQWKQEVAETMERVAEVSRQAVRNTELKARNPSPEQNDDKKRYANALNTYAWLLINVGHDPRHALQLSRLSNRIDPENSAYYDTLARCYYVAGDVANATHWQFRAVRLAPYQRQLVQTWLAYQKESSQKESIQKSTGT